MNRNDAKAKHELARSGGFGDFRRGEMLKVIDEIYDLLEYKTCNNCRFRNDNRKCPMASPESMADSNSCYNWYERT